MGSIELVTDHEWILSVLNDPEMLERISEDGQNIKMTMHDVKMMADHGHLLGWVIDGKLTGFYWIHQFTYSVLQIHAHFPEKLRHYAKGSGKEMLNWLAKNAPENIKRFIAMIPECYQDVIGFSKREGLNNSGKIERSSYRNGECYDLIILGIAREDV